VKAIEEFERVDLERFRGEIAPRYRPAVMRGVVAHWPAVRAASDGGIAAYLRPLGSGAKQMALRMPPSAAGRIFYNPNLDGFNYTKEEPTLAELLDRLERYASHERPPTIVVQSALASACVPRFSSENANPLLDASIAARIWIGNRVVTPAHFDESSNMACVVAGRRRFTLFPPEAVGDLYIGPIGYAPTGTPISLVDFDRPEERRFPRFARAMAVAQVADLEPGDAIYIPPLWWHHVRSLDAINVLVNYWWKERAPSAGTDSALNALMLALLDLRALPAEQRRAWAEIFRHYVFEADGETAAHIPEAKRGVLGEMSPELAKQVRAFLAGKLRD
jgi:hypothetical protein